MGLGVLLGVSLNFGLGHILDSIGKRGAKLADRRLRSSVGWAVGKKGVPFRVSYQKTQLGHVSKIDTVRLKTVTFPRFLATFGGVPSRRWPSSRF